MSAPTRQRPLALTRLATVHTLGPKGTNCELAARFWAAANGLHLEVGLHATLEDGVDAVRSEPSSSALLACVAYPDLHSLVFANLDWMEMVDAFVLDTHPMVLATRELLAPATVSTHPAPQALAPVGAALRLTTSNAQAGHDCLAGLSEGCITTSVVADQLGLLTLVDHGPVAMGFTVHRARADEDAS